MPRFDGLDPRYKRVLWTVIGINGAMFLTEMIAGQLAGSQALQADALDFLGDTVTYGLSLAVIGTSLQTRATAALFKGLSLSLMAFWVLGSTIYHTIILGLPSAELMGGIAVLALAANLASVLMLMRYKDGDANVRSVWLCSRNDAIGNVVVMIAAAGVWGTGTAWPDLGVAALMAGIFPRPRLKFCDRPGSNIVTVATGVRSRRSESAWANAHDQQNARNHGHKREGWLCERWSLLPLLSLLRLASVLRSWRNLRVRAGDPGAAAVA